MDPALQVNLVWSPTGGITHESIPEIPESISTLMQEVSTVGKLAE
jgi:succinate dehydrogenase / fumarate reductase flavoprotein subunit